MKKALALLLALVMCLSLVACGDSSNTENAETEAPTEASHLKATITTNEGTTVEMTAEELIAVFDSNEAKFNKLYLNAKIEFVGTISRIEVDTEVIVEKGGVKASQNKIVFEEGWCLVLALDSTKYDLADYDVGQMVTVRTSIVGAPYDTEFLQTVSDNERVMWLVGNDKFYDGVFGSVETTIRPWSGEQGSTEVAAAAD